ncbi:dTDP-glucose 4,6-dehydratase [Caldanaerobius fijiensis DSM 17918]|uniref:dTDP-glucose 4,6-dehydratase n=1 Tax=Caldanaerobius fijiensis DSM 17918 TaxID=1121256 RepID=A0A1M5CBN4_9THEO|nr:dTDP-glucose 4,6-dehydratase [Caldanaerobius fijiensis]SHF52184.1 dTDP-glucose 4,6-dehydratase [Caldanaerobius fijiensis DSM 17918]
MKVLVTGGAGFIGSNFIKYMLKKHSDYKIINLDKLTYAGNLENLRDIEHNPNYTFIKGDIADRDLVDEIFSKGIDYVVNFAAESHVDRSIEDPSVFLKTNVLGTQVLLDAARKYGVKKCLQISTDEVYGSLRDAGYFTEETPLAPNSPYSASKASADLLVRAYHRTYGLPVNITRCSNNYGPYQFPEKLIVLMIINALHDRELPVYGEGLKKLGKPESLIKYVKDRPGHDIRYAMDSSKIQKELGWRPIYSFENGMRKTIQWYLENKEWWEKLL